MAVRYTFTDQELRERVIELWRLYAKKYREAVPRYLELIDEKRARKMILYRVPKSVLSEMVKIPFFDCDTEEKANKFVSTMNHSEISCLISTIDTAINSYHYRTLSSRILDYEWELTHYNQPKTTFGYDPNYPVSTGGRSRGRNNSGKITES